ncbi:MAG: ABC transporter ATP-binding protein/permease, partial [Spirochaetales bacterium]|nr:ABC transporter ATP-binding protein/permease [Spirochaetales bacterium]
MYLILKRLASYIKPYRGTLAVALGAMVFVDLFAYIVPLAVGYVTDNVYPAIAEDPQELPLIFSAGLILLVVAILRGVAVHVMIRAFWSVAESVVRDLRNRLYFKLQHLDMSFYDRSRTGDLMSRATYDIQLIRNFLAFGLEHRVRIILISVTVFGLMVWQDWRLALAVYTVIPLFVWAILHYSGLMRSAVMRQQRQMGRLNSRLQESISGVRVVKAFAVEESEICRFDLENSEMLDRDLEAALPQAYLNPVLMVTEGVGALILIAVGGVRVIRGETPLGVLVAFISYLGVIGFPLRILAFNTALVNLTHSASDRLVEILQLPDQLRHDGGRRKETIQGKVEFRDVSFCYEDGPMVLDGVDFRLDPGSHIGVFGLTGSGKSTLISLIPRFYLPSSGSILIDGTPLEEWDLQTLRSQVGTVLQDTFLFSATIRENIGFGRPDATLETIIAAAQTAEVHSFINALPDGYETIVGEHGVGLSGGQRQRIAIARTIVQDPRILILDDCTSSLDAVTERQIQD